MKSESLKHLEHSPHSEDNKEKDRPSKLHKIVQSFQRKHKEFHHKIKLHIQKQSARFIVGIKQKEFGSPQIIFFYILGA